MFCTDDYYKNLYNAVIIAERSSYAYLSIVQNLEFWHIGNKSVISKHLSTPLIVGKTSLEENYHDCIDF